MIGAKVRVRDRSRSIGKAVRAISRTLARRIGEAKAQVMALNEQAGRLIARSAARPSDSRRGQSIGAWARRQGEAQGREQARASWRTALQQGGRADRPSRPRAEDHRPARLDRGPRRPPDPQGQARQTDRVRVRRADLRDHREHPQRRPRVDPPRRALSSGTRPRTRCCHRPPPSSTTPGSGPGRSSPTAAFSPAPPKTRSPT